MNTNELVSKLAEETGMPKTAAKKAIDVTLEAIASAIDANEEVSLPVLGKLVAVHTPAREGRNPATGGTVTIPAGRKVRFKASKAIKDRLNGSV